MINNKRLRTLIIDNSPSIRNTLERSINRIPEFLVVGKCGYVRDAITLIEIYKPHLLIVDIHLGTVLSFDILRVASEKAIKVILLAADETYALEALKIGVIDYVLKPINKEEFLEALQKVIEYYNSTVDTANSQENSKKKTHRRLAVKYPEYTKYFEPHEIIYCKSHGGYTTFHIAPNIKYVASKYLKEFDEILLPEFFIRPHQSYSVNIHFISGYSRNGILFLKDGTEIPVSVRRRELVKAILKSINERNRI